MPACTTAVPAEDWKSSPPAAESPRTTADAATAVAIAGKCASTPRRRSDRREPATALPAASARPANEIAPSRLHSQAPVAAGIEHDECLGRGQARDGAPVGRPHRLGEAEQLETDRVEPPR